MSQIEDKAYLMVSQNEIGVTNDEYDFPEVIRNLKPGESLKIEAGYKEALLDKETTLLRIDAIVNAHGEDKVLFPIRNNGYNLVQRNRDEQKLRQFYNYIEPEQRISPVEQQDIFGGLIEGGGKDVK